MPKYLTRELATQYVRDQGIPVNDNRLADLAHEKRGAQYIVINNRALYTKAWLDAWIKREAALSLKKPDPQRRRRQPPAAPDAAA